jgi:hypothetical protein
MIFKKDLFALADFSERDIYCRATQKSLTTKSNKFFFFVESWTTLSSDAAKLLYSSALDSLRIDF